MTKQQWLQSYGAQLIRKYALPFGGAYALTLGAYSYFFTTIVFTNHFFPNA